MTSPIAGLRTEPEGKTLSFKRGLPSPRPLPQTHVAFDLTAKAGIHGHGTDEPSSTANEASSTSDEASSTANEASSTADEASSTANEASSTADEASSTANEASSEANEAAFQGHWTGGSVR
jgi:hypothetical protein